MLTTPKVAHRFVSELCEELVAGQEPVWIGVFAELGAMAEQSVAVVTKKVAADGGELQFGWVLREIAGRYLEAQFQCVWRSPEGDLRDIVPNLYGNTEVLFLPDPERRVGEGEEYFYDCVRRAQMDDALVQEYIDLAAEYHAFLDGAVDADDVQSQQDDVLKNQQYIDRLTTLLGRVAQLPVGRNDLCACGCGMKSKRCNLSSH